MRKVSMSSNKGEEIDREGASERQIKRYMERMVKS